MRRVSRYLVALGLISAALGDANAIEIATSRGPVDIPSKPSRIAVFDIAAIDTLDRLGIAIAGVPDNLFVSELKHVADEADVVGSLFEPDLEALSALAPELIVVGGRSSTQLDAASRVAPTIDMTLYGVELIQEARDRIVAYGKLFDRADAASTILGELDAAILRARSAVAGKGTALMLMTSGPKITAYGADSRFGWLHRELALPAAIETSAGSEHGEAVSFEFVRQANPDWLIIVDRAAAIGSGEAAAAVTLDNELVASTTASRKGQVVYLPSADFYIASGGVSSTIRVLDALTVAFAGK